MYKVVDRNNKSVIVHPSKAYCDAKARKIGGRVCAVGNNRISVKRNPEGEYKTKPDSYSTRIQRFDQYPRSTASNVWTRETIQNSVDGKATEIMISIVKITNGKNAGCEVVRIMDNGKGMTEETLLTKFLTEGGTDKGERGEDTGSMGGFGEAKKVILFGWQAWRVISKRANESFATIVESLNGGYKYVYDKSEVPFGIQSSGTIVEILTWPANKYKVMISDSINLISKCDLPNIRFWIGCFLETSVYGSSFAYNQSINKDIYQALRTGVPNQRFSVIREKLYLDQRGLFDLGQSKKTLSAEVGNPPEIPMRVRECAKIYAKHTTDRPRLFYRVKGLFLWEEYIDPKVRHDVIVDFTVVTTLILSDSRDAIKHQELKDTIDEWLITLQQDPSMILRGFSPRRCIVHQGSLGAMTAPIKPVAIEAARAIADLGGMSLDKESKNKALVKIADKVVERILEINEEQAPDSPVKINSDVAIEFIKYEAKNAITKQHDPNAVQDAIERAVAIPEYMVYIEDDLYYEKYVIPEKFMADKLTIEIKKILAVWVEMIRVIFMLKGSKQKFGVGFVFSSSVTGLYYPGELLQGQSGVFRGIKAEGFILINPFKPDMANRKKLIDVSDPSQLKGMWSIAVHEATHMIDHVGMHDQAFASALTENVGVTAGIYGLIQEIAKIVTTTDTLKRDKFAGELDIESYLDDSIKKPRSSREKSLEKYATDLALELSQHGLRLPSPAQYGITLSDTAEAEIERVKGSHGRLAEATGTSSRIMLELQKRKLEKAEARIRALESEEKIEAPKRLSLDISRVTKKYNA